MKTKIEELNILGYKFEVHYVDANGLQSDVGATDTIKQVISIDENAHDEHVLSTIIHEALEVINTKLTLGLDETTILQLEAALFHFLKANPKLTAKFLTL